VWYASCQEAWNWRQEEAKRGEMTRVQCVECRRKDTIVRKMKRKEKREKTNLVS